MLKALQCSIKARAYCGNEASETTEEVSTISCSNILKLCTLALITVMANTEVQIIHDLQHHKPQGQPLSILILESNFYNMNVYIGNVSSQDQKYDVTELPAEEQDPQWHQIEQQYLLDKTRDGSGEKAKFQKFTLHASSIFGLGMGPEFSSDIAGDGPRKIIFDDDEFDPKLERSKKRKI